MRRFVCKWIRRETTKIQYFRAGCWCSALPPLSWSGIASAFGLANTLRRKLLFVAAAELETLALADLRLEAIGLSPLTGEDLMFDEAEFDFVSVRRSLEVTFCDANCDNIFVGCGGELSLPTSRLVEGRLASLVSALPPASLARAKASLALGLSYLKGFYGPSNDTSLMGICKQITRGQRSPHAATQEIRIAEMLLFEATCVLDQHTTTEPARARAHVV